MGSQVAVRKRMPEVALQLSNGAWGHGGAIVLSYGSYGLRLYNCYIMYNNSLYYTYIYISPIWVNYNDLTVLPHWKNG